MHFAILGSLEVRQLVPKYHISRDVRKGKFDIQVGGQNYIIIKNIGI